MDNLVLEPGSMEAHKQVLRGEDPEGQIILDGNVLTLFPAGVAHSEPKPSG